MHIITIQNSSQKIFKQFFIIPEHISIYTMQHGAWKIISTTDYQNCSVVSVMYYHL